MGQSQIRKDNNGKLFIEGEHIYLREIRLSDANKTYCKWMNDPDITRYLESRFEKWSIKKLEDYVAKIQDDPNYVFLSIILKDGKKHIGNIKIGPINWIHKFADVGLIIGEKSFWGRGLATEVLKLIIDYAFNTLNLHKLTAGAYANNVGSIRAFEKAGFLIEGIKKKHYLYNGYYADSLLLGIFRE